MNKEVVRRRHSFCTARLSSGSLTPRKTAPEIPQLFPLFSKYQCLTRQQHHLLHCLHLSWNCPDHLIHRWQIQPCFVRKSWLVSVQPNHHLFHPLHHSPVSMVSEYCLLPPKQGSYGFCPASSPEQ